MKMNKKLVPVFILFFVCAMIFSMQPVWAQSSEKIVVFEDGTTEKAKNEFNKKTKLKVTKELKGLNAQVVEASLEVAEILKYHPDVKYVEDDFDIYLDEPNFQNQIIDNQMIPWGVNAVQAPRAWENYDPDSPVKIGIMDTGIDFDHPDLNVAGGVSFVDMNLVAEPGSYADDAGHGTHVAGTIAALNNEEGVVGVFPAAELYAIKSFDYQGHATLSALLEGLAWAMENDLDILNMSLGATQYSAIFEETINKAHEAGIILVASAGNTASAIEYPAAFENVISVAAVDNNLFGFPYNCTGPEMDIAAPGVDIFSTMPLWVLGMGFQEPYFQATGTSMAAPHVTGAIAWMVNDNPKITLKKVRKNLAKNAVDLGEPGLDDIYGAGFLKIFKK